MRVCGDEGSAEGGILRNVGFRASCNAKGGRGFLHPAVLRTDLTVVDHHAVGFSGDELKSTEGIFLLEGVAFIYDVERIVIGKVRGRAVDPLVSFAAFHTVIAVVVYVARVGFVDQNDSDDGEILWLLNAECDEGIACGLYDGDVGGSRGINFGAELKGCYDFFFVFSASLLTTEAFGFR